MLKVRVPITLSSPAPSMLRPVSYETHAWCIPLQQCEAYLGSLWDVLSHDERHRAKRYRFEAASCRFVCRRGALRIILGRYLGVEPGYLRFAQSALGKPYLVAGGWVPWRMICYVVLSCSGRPTEVSSASLRAQQATVLDGWLSAKRTSRELRTGEGNPRGYRASRL
jgi:hypothetical protein